MSTWSCILTAGQTIGDSHYTVPEEELRRIAVRWPGMYRYDEAERALYARMPDVSHDDRPRSIGYTVNNGTEEQR